MRRNNNNRKTNFGSAFSLFCAATIFFFFFLHNKFFEGPLFSGPVHRHSTKMWTTLGSIDDLQTRPGGRNQTA